MLIRGAPHFTCADALRHFVRTEPGSGGECHSGQERRPRLYMARVLPHRGSGRSVNGRGPSYGLLSSQRARGAQRITGTSRVTTDSASSWISFSVIGTFLNWKLTWSIN